MNNRHNYSAKERRMVINAITGTAYTIFLVFKKCRSMGFNTQYLTAIEALCKTTDALVGDAGGRDEVIQRLGDAMKIGFVVRSSPVDEALLSSDTALTS